MDLKGFRPIDINHMIWGIVYKNRDCLYKLIFTNRSDIIGKLKFVQTALIFNDKGLCY